MTPFFTNPFAPAGGAPLLPATTAISPSALPVPASLRRTSLVRAAAPGSADSASPSSYSISGASPASSSGASAAGGASAPSGGITFVSPFASSQKRGSIAHSTVTITPGRRPSTPGSPARPSTARSSSQSRSVSGGESPILPPSRRASIQGTPSPLRSPAASTAHAPPFFSGIMAGATSTNGLLKVGPDFSRRRSVDVGVLGQGTHRMHGVTAMSRRVRDAIGPDAGDKETGLVGAGGKGGKDRLLGRHLASLLAHSLALCAEPKLETVSSTEEIVEQLAQPPHLEPIPASPLTSPTPSRNTSVSAESVTLNNAGIIPPSFPNDEPAEALSPRPAGPQFPVLSEAKRFKLIANLQSWSFNAMSYSSDELLSCVGIIFESVRNMEGVEFDLDRFKQLLMSLRSAYHARNGYHNFNHAADVTQACYSFLVRMGLAPPLYLLCEDDYDANLGEGRRKWRRNRAVEKSGFGELLRPMDVFALMVACIGHDVGHPGLTNAYMVNARAPVAQIYDDKSILENFHTVTLIHMLRKHEFDYLLGGDFGRLGDQATPFRKIVEASILATDMSRHFAFVTEITEMGKRFGQKRPSNDVEADRLLLCSGLIKCADISNPTRPHRISRIWAAALQEEWAVQASIEANFGLPITVMTQDPNDVKAQAKGQVGFIDLFCKPLFAAMSTVVDEFTDFVEKLRDGRSAWEAISLQTDEAFAQPISREFKMAAAPPLRRRKNDDPAAAFSPGSFPALTPSAVLAANSASDVTPTPSALPTPILPATKTVPVPIDTRRTRPTPLRPVSHRPAHGRQGSNGSLTSTNTSPLSPSFATSASASSAATGFSSFSPLSSVSLNNGPQTADSISLFSPKQGDPFASASLLSTSGDRERIPRSVCGGACLVGTAMCEVCAAAQRRGSLGNAFEERDRQFDDDEDDEELELLEAEEVSDVWPPHPFQPTKGAVSATPLPAAAA
ncbi:3',5'-cyclic-nucleotide phosphodiesterase PDE2 [Rhodotorula paludigena]|uniref:3',5'-cyclic-nucleotide phosphodiesterase PDE2 n=1 Tax=Rhodotorula paludigena TaxID=86838 RepID=UPI0031713974